MSRYDRQICLPEVGPHGQARLARARVLVVGAGGLGCTVLPLLAGAGIGNLQVVDPDRVEISNLHRQVLFRAGDVGQPKADCVARALHALNDECQVQPLVARLDPVLAAALIDGHDVVVDAADSFAVTYALSDLCRDRGVPLISASVLARAGYVGGFCGQAPGYRAVFPDLPPGLQTCAGGGVMGPAVATLGALQAQMVLAVLLGHDPSPLGQMIRVDLGNWRMSSFRFDAAPDPETAGPAILGRSQVGGTDLVIELRDEDEAPQTLPNARRMTVAQADALQPAADSRVVFVCGTGLRAWRAATRLAQRCPVRVAIVAEGS